MFTNIAGAGYTRQSLGSAAAAAGSADCEARILSASLLFPELIILGATRRIGRDMDMKNR